MGGWGSILALVGGGGGFLILAYKCLDYESFTSVKKRSDTPSGAFWTLLDTPKTLHCAFKHIDYVSISRYFECRFFEVLTRGAQIHPQVGATHVWIRGEAPSASTSQSIILMFLTSTSLEHYAERTIFNVNSLRFWPTGGGTQSHGWLRLCPYATYRTYFYLIHGAMIPRRYVLNFDSFFSREFDLRSANPHLKMNLTLTCTYVDYLITIHSMSLPCYYG
ncbi:hypothetical protein CPC08DRAFT_722033 [Agrocybe pediades]|nr:hypothetical protein CPC08DRAFT_722033 [Agrocybe pediades]